ncbi:trans-2-enoyl-CoA reductase family protein [Cytobacillus spongiae]|uniref:enoyl-ACP reductase FabV n=1 Tax=Cytobacillus spongiae TaxID=2901381 RepID=UPI001F3F8405|nr:enoyl-ACP reductase FabV [Cytobacillus spongiae]UII57607.1 trans-2-enoyl-CoA reductase family protein [Cytobacillus spongiae]
MTTTEQTLPKVAIRPVLKGNIARAAHPYGCEAAIKEQIAYVKENGKFEGPKKALILGASSSYGLASRISLAFGADADTIGVSFERGITSPEQTGTAGWWNNIFFRQEAEKAELTAKNFIGDAFSKKMKDEVIQYIKNEFGGKIDILVYSLASPKRIDPKTGDVYSSCIKSIGDEVKDYSINLEKQEIFEQVVEPATEQEIADTVKVMGGEDWELWVNELMEAGVLAEGFKTVLYSYLGPEITRPFYSGGTLGRAKEHAAETSNRMDKVLKEKLGGESVICVSKAVTTKASAVIPILPVYASALYKVMIENGVHETPIMHKHRFFMDMLYGSKREYDEKGYLRPDSWELREDIQAKVKEIVDQVTPENFRDLTAVNIFTKEFLQLNGFEIAGVDYEAEVDLEELRVLLP